jgi:hypothetical protein
MAGRKIGKIGGAPMTAQRAATFLNKTLEEAERIWSTFQVAR